MRERVGTARVASGCIARDVGVELGFRNQGEAACGPDEAALRRPDRERRARVAPDELVPVGAYRRLEAVFGEVLLHGFAPAKPVG